MKGYITANTFDEFNKNQRKLIDVLNHSVTELKIDVSWLKRLQFWQLGILGAILITLLTVVIRL